MKQMSQEIRQPKYGSESNRNTLVVHLLLNLSNVYYGTKLEY